MLNVLWITVALAFLTERAGLSLTLGAFLGGRLEWVGGVNDGADRPEASDYGPTALSRLEVVRWRGIDLKVPPLDLQLAANERRGRAERAGQIRQWLIGRGALATGTSN